MVTEIAGPEMVTGSPLPMNITDPKVVPLRRSSAETLDAFGGAIKSVDDRPSQKLKMPFVNPQNGPIFVEGAERGDGCCQSKMLEVPPAVVALCHEQPVSIFQQLS
jgi:hypothetical protein